MSSKFVRKAVELQLFVGPVTAKFKYQRGQISFSPCVIVLQDSIAISLLPSILERDFHAKILIWIGRGYHVFEERA